MILQKFHNRTLKMPKSISKVLKKTLKTLMISDLSLCTAAEKTIFYWSVPGKMKTNYGKACIMMVPDNLKYGTETKPTSQLIVSGKWVLSIMNLSPGKNIWAPEEKTKIKRPISIIFLKEKCNLNSLCLLMNEIVFNRTNGNDLLLHHFCCFSISSSDKIRT